MTFLIIGFVLGVVPSVKGNVNEEGSALFCGSPEDVSGDGRQCEREFFGRTNLEGSFRRKHKVEESFRIESRK